MEDLRKAFTKNVEEFDTLLMEVLDENKRLRKALELEYNYQIDNYGKAAVWLREVIWKK